MFLSILGKTASLISVIFSICACKLSSEHSSVITLLIASSPSSRGVTRVPPKHDKKWTTLGSGRNVGVDRKKSPINVVIPVVVLFIHDLPEDAGKKKK